MSGTRNTKHKKTILTVLQKQHLMTMSELSKKIPSIPFSTIYRNIERFVKEGIISQVTLQNGTVAYEIVDEPHDHFICKACNQIDSVHVDPKKIISHLPKGSKVQSGNITILGLCTNCT